MVGGVPKIAGGRWRGRVVPPPFPPAVGLEGMLRQNERDVLLAAHFNMGAVRGMPAQRSSASTRTWVGAQGAPLTTRSIDPNDALPVIDSRGRYFGHGAVGRQRMIAHAQEVMAGGSVARVPFLSELKEQDPFADDIRERPHTPIVDGNTLPVRFIGGTLRPSPFLESSKSARDLPFRSMSRRPSTSTTISSYNSDRSNSGCGSSPRLRRQLVLRR